MVDISHSDENIVSQLVHDGAKHLYEINAFFGIVFIFVGFAAIISVYLVVKNHINKRNIKDYNNFNFAIFIFCFFISYFFTFAMVKYASFDLFIFDGNGENLSSNVILKYFSFLYVLVFNAIFVGAYIYDENMITKSFIKTTVFTTIGTTFVQYFFNANDWQQQINIVELNFGFQIFVLIGGFLFAYSLLNKKVNYKYDIYGEIKHSTAYMKADNYFNDMIFLTIGFISLPIIKMINYNSIITMGNVSMTIKNVFLTICIAAIIYYINKKINKVFFKKVSIYVFMISSLISINEIVLIQNSMFIIAVCLMNYLGMIIMENILIKLRIYDNFSLIKMFFIPSIISIIMTSVVGYSNFLPQIIGIFIIMFVCFSLSFVMKIFFNNN